VIYPRLIRGRSIAVNHVPETLREVEMETAVFDPELGADVRRDALAELRNHADAEAASARDDGDRRRVERIREMATRLERDDVLPAA
jgi:hypothetical protein